MGCDKALLTFHGTALIDLALEKLRALCPAISVAGNRDDLAVRATVVRELRHEAGPAAGLEAGLAVSTLPWALFIPVDVPLAPGLVLTSWARQVLRAEADGVRLSYLRISGQRHPTFCLLHTDCLGAVTAALDQGERKLGVIFDRVASSFGRAAVLPVDGEALLPSMSGDREWLERCFSNLNTPEDVAALERCKPQQDTWNAVASPKEAIRA